MPDRYNPDGIGASEGDGFLKVALHIALATCLVNKANPRRRLGRQCIMWSDFHTSNIIAGRWLAYPKHGAGMPLGVASQPYGYSVCAAQGPATLKHAAVSEIW